MTLDRDELLRLKDDLHSDDPVRHEGAVCRLLSLVEATAPSMLVEALASDSTDVREQALQLLERMAESGDPTLEHVATAVRGVGPGA